MLLLTVLILSSEETAVVTPLGEFAISSALMNISRKISRRGFSSGIESSSAVTGMVNCPSFYTNNIASSHFDLQLSIAFWLMQVLVWLVKLLKDH